MEKVNLRTHVLSMHLSSSLGDSHPVILQSSPCISYSPPELSEPAAAFDVVEMRELMDGYSLEERDWLYGLMVQCQLFNPRERGGTVYVIPDYDQSMEQQREMTMKRLEYLTHCGAFRGLLTGKRPESELRKLVFVDVGGIFDLSLAIMFGVHFILWYSRSLCFFSFS